MVIIGRTWWACVLGVSCIAPLLIEKSQALAVCCPATSVLVQCQQSSASIDRVSPPHIFMIGLICSLAW